LRFRSAAPRIRKQMRLGVRVNYTSPTAIISTDSISTVCEPMIRTVALGIVCLAGLGAIAAAAKKSPPPESAEVVSQVAVAIRPIAC
jgi:hypothetical protein